MAFLPLPGTAASFASDSSLQALRDFEDVEAMLLAGRSLEGAEARLAQRNPPPDASTHAQGNPLSGGSTRKSSENSPPGIDALSGHFPGGAQGEEDLLNTSVSSDDMNRFRLEVLQRLSEDRLRDIPHEDQAELEDDDPISRARQLPSPREPQPEEPCRASMADPGAEILSPIREISEPFSSTATTDPNSGSSTAPSTPCSPLDVAPFTPSFFTTSPANSLDRRKVGGLDGWTDGRGLGTSADGLTETTDGFPSEPTFSETPRCQVRSREPNVAANQSKSFEKLARGSYTVDHLPVEAAKAAGIPVIGHVSGGHGRDHFDEQEPNVAGKVSDVHVRGSRASLDPVLVTTQLVDASEIRPTPTISSSLPERLRNSPRGDWSCGPSSGRLDPEGGHVTDGDEAAKRAMGTKPSQHANTAAPFRFSLDDVRNLERTRGNGYGTYTKDRSAQDFDSATFKKASGLTRQHQSLSSCETEAHDLRQGFDRYATYRKDSRSDQPESGRATDEADRVRGENSPTSGETNRELANSEREANGSARGMDEADRTSTESGRRRPEEGRIAGDLEDGLRRFGTYTKLSRSEEQDRGDLHGKNISGDFSQRKLVTELDQRETTRKSTEQQEKPHGTSAEDSTGQVVTSDHGPNSWESSESNRPHNERHGNSAEETTAQAFTFDHDPTSPREPDRRSSESNRPQQSPSSLCRSRTFRKKPNGDIIVEDIPIESEGVPVDETVAPSPRRSSVPNEVASAPTPRCEYSESPRGNESPRRESPVGIRSDVVRTSWSEEARTGYPEGAEVKVSRARSALVTSLQQFTFSTKPIMFLCCPITRTQRLPSEGDTPRSTAAAPALGRGSAG